MFAAEGPPSKKAIHVYQPNFMHMPQLWHCLPLSLQQDVLFKTLPQSPFTTRAQESAASKRCELSLNPKGPTRSLRACHANGGDTLLHTPVRPPGIPRGGRPAGQNRTVSKDQEDTDHADTAPSKP